MKFNENTVKGKWLEIKGEVQKSWGKLTNDEIDKTQGDMKALGGIIQQKYGEAQESYNKKLSDIVNRFETKKEKVVQNIKQNLKS
ncbi:MAG TPA: CsbD family protein [Pseudobdellovibrionaceae bacterium]|nr:CsbD family protein [Pseudobdellovibrionaceae bacterium]